MNPRGVTNPHTRYILKIGLPIMLGQMGVILVGFIDNIMVGWYGTPELGAASFVNNFLNLAFVFAMGFSYGLTPLVSGSYARANGKLHSLLKNSFVLNLLVGVILTLIMWICLINLHWFKQPSELIPLIKPYYTIQLVSIIPLIVFYGYKQFVDGVGSTKVSMSAILISNAINVLFNWLLIFGKFGLPELGLVGAGLGTLFSRLIMLGILIYEVHGTDRFRKIFHQNKSTQSQLNGAVIRKLTQIGLPSGVQMGLETGSFSIAVIMVGWIGTVELAAHQVVTTIGTLGFMMFYGMSAAVMIRVGHFYELKQPIEIQKVVQSGLKIQLGMVATLILFLITLRFQIPKIFSNDQEVIGLVSVLIFPLVAYQVSDMLQILFSNALRGMQDVKFTAWAAAFCYIFLTVTVAYIFGFVLKWGIIGVWSAFFVGFTTLASLLIYRYRRVLKSLVQDIESKRIK